MEIYESIETCGVIAEISTRVNIGNSIQNLDGAYKRMGAIFPVSGDVIALGGKRSL